MTRRKMADAFHNLALVFCNSAFAISRNSRLSIFPAALRGIASMTMTPAVRDAAVSD